MVPTGNYAGEPSPKKKMKIKREPFAFGNDDFEGTVQPHDDVLVVMARISSFLVKRVIVDQGSEADMMYPDLFKGLGEKAGTCRSMIRCWSGLMAGWSSLRVKFPFQ